MEIFNRAVAGAQKSTLLIRNTVLLLGLFWFTGVARAETYSFSSSWIPESQTPTAVVEYTDYDGSFTLSWPGGGSYGGNPFNIDYSLRHPTPFNEAYSVTGLSRHFTNLPDGIYPFKVEGCYYEWDYNAEQLYFCAINSVMLRITVNKAPMLVPANFSVPPTSGNGLYTVSWSSVAHAAYYRLDEQTNGGNWVPVTLDSPLQTGKVFSDKSSGNYRYRVKACNGGEVCGDYTVELDVDVAVAPATPTALNVSPALSDGDVEVHWSAGGGVAHYYSLNQQRNGDVWSPAYAGGDLHKAMQGLAMGTYHYKVQACTEVNSYINCSGWTPPSAAAVVAVPDAPDAPVLNLPAQTPVGNYTVTWDEVFNANEYKLEEKFNAGMWAIIYQGNNTSHAVSRAEGHYQYRIRACNNLGCNVSEVVSIEVIGPPGVPGNIQGPATDDDGLYALSWSAASGLVDEYPLEERVNGGAWDVIYSGAATATTVTVSTVGNYEYRVRACNAAGCGAYTAITSVSVTIGGTGTVNEPQAPLLATPSVGGNEILATDRAQSTQGEFDVGPGGQASYTIDILTAPAGGGTAPKINLSYSSGGGNGLVGLGWSLNGLGSISRCRQTEGQDKNAAPITWSEQDRFCLNGDRLLVTAGTYGAVNSTYNTEIDRYARITAQGGSLGKPASFKVEYKDGTISYYGETGDSRYTLATGKVLTWAINKSEDSAGNHIDYHYINDTHGQRIGSIDYAFDNNGGNPAAELVFTYATRSDPVTGYVAGHAYRTGQRLKAIASKNNGQQIRQYNLEYNEGTASTTQDRLSRLTSIEECVNSVCLPPTEFEWALPQIGFSSDSTTHPFTGGVWAFKPADINGDGLMDLVWTDNGAPNLKKLRYALAGRTAQGGLQFTNTAFTHGSLTLNGSPQIEMIDYNADGRQDVLMGAQMYPSRPQSDGSWKLSHTPLSLNTELFQGAQFLDLNADGLVDILGWTLERPFPAPYTQWTQANKVHYLEAATQAGVTSEHYYQFGAQHSLTHVFPEGYASPVIPHYGPHDGWSLFPDPRSQPIAQMTAQRGDFNGDGRVDVIAYAVSQIECSWYGTDDIDFCQWHGAAHVYTTHPAPDGGIELRFFDTFNGSAERMIVADFNGDGLSDVLYYADSGWWYRLNNAMGFEPAMDVGLSIASSQVSPEAADYNADGHPDVLWHAADGTIKARLWNPAVGGFESTVLTVAPAPYDTLSNYPDPKTQSIWQTFIAHQHLFIDLDGDGREDWVRIPRTMDGDLRVRLNSGGGAAENKIVRITGGLGSQTRIEYEALTHSDHYSHVQGVSNSTDETVCQTTDSGNTCWPREVAKAGSADFYSAINDPWQSLPANTQTLGAPHAVLDIIGPMSIVTQVTHTAPSADPQVPEQINANATRSLSYYYERARMQAAGRGFLGFKEFSIVDHQTGLRSVSKFRQDWPWIGSPWKTEVRTQSNHLLNETRTRWGFVNCYDSSGNPDNTCDESMQSLMNTAGSAALGPLQLFLRERESKTYALDNNGASQGAQLSRVLNKTVQDGKGNSLEEQSLSYAGNSTLLLDKTTHNTWSYPSPSWSLQQGRLVRMDVSSTDGTDTLNRRSSFTYYTSGEALGLIKTETIEPDEADYTVTTTHVYDGFGNKIKTSTVADGQTRTRRVEYDDRGRFIDKTYERFTGNVERLIHQVIGRDKYGTPTTVRTYVDANHYITAITDTTDFGIPYFSADSSGAWTQSTAGRQDTEYESLCPSTTVTWNRSESAGGAESLVCADLRGRTLRKAARGFDGNWSVIDSEYDASDRTLRISEPTIPNTQSVYWTQFKNHDRLGRVRHIDHPDGGDTEMVYNGYTTTTTNPNGQTRSETQNALGQKVEVTDPLNGDTLFAYDPRGNLTSMMDPAGNTTVMEYDLRDRKIAMRDPDKGSWSYHYNRFNELICQQDANGQIIKQSYDLRGRLKTRIDYTAGGNCANPSGSIESNTTWTYDTAAYGLGKLDNVTDAVSDYEKQISYDALGRVSQTRTTFPGYNSPLSHHFEKVTYDEFGRPFQVFDAARNTDAFNTNGIEHEYNPYGYLVKVKNAEVSGSLQEVYYEVEDMDARGNVTRAFYGNGVTRNAGYDDKTGRALSLTATTALNTLQDLELVWDLVGNLQYRHETGIGKGTQARDLYEEFDYDNMNRLIGSDLSGDYSDTINIAYDNIGNITSKSGVGTYSYNPSGSGSIRPHAVIETSGTINATYSYDNNGNQLSGDGRAISYIVADLPKVITKGSHTTEFFYSPDRARFKRVDTNGSNSTTTLYLGSVEKVYNPDGSIQWKRDIAGVALITHTFNSGGTLTDTKTNYLVKDHLGTLSLILDNTGNVQEEYYFDAWGKRRTILLAQNINIFAKPTTTRGYTGHEMLDEVGLVHMNGRIYDQTLSRFVQADPIIQDPFKTESLNRYSYVWNNPLNATDPSGFVADCSNSPSESQCQKAEANRESEQKQTQRNNESGGTVHRDDPVDETLVEGTRPTPPTQAQRMGKAFAAGEKAFLLKTLSESWNQMAVEGFFYKTVFRFVSPSAAHAASAQANNGTAISVAGGTADSAAARNAGAGDSEAAKEALGESQGGLTQEQINVSFGYTNSAVHVGNHALVIATDPITGEQYATRGGPVQNAEGNWVIQGQADVYNENFKDKPSQVHTTQNVGTLNISLATFASRATEFANVTNSNNVPYLGITSNSNSYAFTFVESLGLSRPEPSVWAPGWNSGTVSPSLSY